MLKTPEVTREERLEAALTNALEELREKSRAITALIAVNSDLRQALQPFGRAARRVAFSGQYTDIQVYGPSGGFARLSVDDFRKAAQALGISSGPGKEEYS